MLRTLCVVMGMCVIGGMASAADWPAFRGGMANTIAEGKNYPTEWSSTKNLRWRAKLPGDANSSPIVIGGKVFVTTAENDGKIRNLHCFDRKTGDEIWTKSIQFESEEPTHQTNPYSGSTPVSDGERIIVWHGTPGIFCYDIDGELQWHKELGKVTHIWGYGSSPILHEDLVILNFGPGAETFLVALNKRTGKILWKTDEPGGNDDRSGRMVGSWSTPVVVTVDKKPQILCSMPTRVVAYDPADGTILWTIGGLPSDRGDLVYTSVFVSGEVGVAMGGYKGPSIGFRLGGSGDVTETNRIWQQKAAQPQRIGTGVIWNDHIYMANAGPGTLECIDLKTGEERWAKRVAGNHWGSLVMAGGRFYVTNQKGTTYVFAPDPEKCELLAENSLKEPSNATPAFSDGEIFLRTSKALYCIANDPK